MAIPRIPLENVVKTYTPFRIDAYKSILLYRSLDRNNTAIYFTEVDYDKRDTAEACFEVLLCTDLEFFARDIFVRYPGTEHFVQLHYINSCATGTMWNVNAINVWSTLFEAHIAIKYHNQFMVYDDNCKFNFLSLVACIHDEEPSMNVQDIVTATAMNYVELPKEVRSILYIYKDGKGTFYVVDGKAYYHFDYNDCRIRTVKNGIVEEYIICVDDTLKIRDGFVVTDADGQRHILTLHNIHELEDATWDDIQLSLVTAEEMAVIVSSLNIIIEPDFDTTQYMEEQAELCIEEAKNFKQVFYDTK